MTDDIIPATDEQIALWDRKSVAFPSQRMALIARIRVEQARVADLERRRCGSCAHWEDNARCGDGWVGVAESCQTRSRGINSTRNRPVVDGWHGDGAEFMTPEDFGCTEWVDLA